MKVSLWQAALGLMLSGMMGAAAAKLPPPPPVDPAKAEEAKQKAAEATKKDAELLAKYMDKAAMNYAAKAKSEGKEFKPQLGPGVPPAPAPVAAPPPTGPAAAVAPPPTVSSAPEAPAKK
jgi:hypothetical protein